MHYDWMKACQAQVKRPFLLSYIVINLLVFRWRTVYLWWLGHGWDIDRVLQITHYIVCPSYLRLIFPFQHLNLPSILMPVKLLTFLGMYHWTCEPVTCTKCVKCYSVLSLALCRCQNFNICIINVCRQAQDSNVIFCSRFFTCSIYMIVLLWVVQNLIKFHAHPFFEFTISLSKND